VKHKLVLSDDSSAGSFARPVGVGWLLTGFAPAGSRLAHIRTHSRGCEAPNCDSHSGGWDRTRSQQCSFGRRRHFGSPNPMGNVSLTHDLKLVLLWISLLALCNMQVDRALQLQIFWTSQANQGLKHCRMQYVIIGHIEAAFPNRCTKSRTIAD
jgi:hypothetical protein